jgi:hypothetical protein
VDEKGKISLQSTLDAIKSMPLMVDALANRATLWNESQSTYKMLQQNVRLITRMLKQNRIPSPEVKTFEDRLINTVKRCAKKTGHVFLVVRHFQHFALF